MRIIIYLFEMLNPNTKSILPNTNQIFMHETANDFPPPLLLLVDIM